MDKPILKLPLRRTVLVLCDALCSGEPLAGRRLQSLHGFLVCDTTCVTKCIFSTLRIVITDCGLGVDSVGPKCVLATLKEGGEGGLVLCNVRPHNNINNLWVFGPSRTRKLRRHRCIAVLLCEFSKPLQRSRNHILLCLYVTSPQLRRRYVTSANKI